MSTTRSFEFTLPEESSETRNDKKTNLSLESQKINPTESTEIIFKPIIDVKKEELVFTGSKDISAKSKSIPTFGGSVQDIRLDPEHMEEYYRLMFKQY